MRTRREALGLAGLGVAASYGTGLLSMAVAAEEQGDSTYKALVCVFLYGGNDHANTVIPYDATNYARYKSARGAIAIPHEELAATVLRPVAEQALTDDMRLALSPHLPKLSSRFSSGDLAVLFNTGPLIAPLTKAQYEDPNTSRFPRPPKLFSHNDQQSTWQSFEAEGAISGWGGRIADQLQSQNTNAMFTAMNASSNAVFISGETSFPYKVGRGGASTIDGLRHPTFGEPLRQILNTHHSHMFEQDYSSTVARSIEYGQFVNEALGSSSLGTAFPNDNRLADQLAVVARMIAARRKFGVNRQVFFVSLGGFDHHTNLLSRHATLMSQVDDALDAFFRATIELGISKSVTTFTASDFGRTLSSNGDGSDHGWGSHHFVLGGDVRGGLFYGTAPRISVNSNDQVGNGRLLPTVSVDEYSATLSKWLGVPDSELNKIAPNIGRFGSPDLGFMGSS